MTKDIYQEIHDKFDSPSQNNSRAIVKGIIDRAVAKKSISRFQEVENDFGFPYDFTDDWGNEPVALTE